MGACSLYASACLLFRFCRPTQVEKKKCEARARIAFFSLPELGEATLMGARAAAVAVALRSFLLFRLHLYSARHDTRMRFDKPMLEANKKKKMTITPFFVGF